MEKLLIGVLSFILVIGLTSAAAGSFGEVASQNACHCLMFNSTNKTNVWTLYSSFNKSMQFYVVKPNLTDITIITSVTNGTIQPNSYYSINVTVTSKSPINESGYLSAYLAGGNTTPGGASIRLGTNKLIKVAANETVKEQQATQQVGSSNQSIETLNTAGSTTIQSTENKSGSTQGALGSSTNSSATTSPYMIWAIVVLIIVVCVMAYYIVSGKKPKSKKKGSYR